MNSKIFILLPVHNRYSITKKFIDCLLNQTYLNYHLILIDDGSTDGTSEMVKSKVANLTILYGNGSWWWAGSLQKGIEWLKLNAINTDIVLFINDDVIFSSDFLSTGQRLLNLHGGMLLPQVMNVDTGRIEESGIEANLKKLTFTTSVSPANINCLPTRGLFMHMDSLKRNGDFRPKLLPHYLSDYEYTIRAFKKGIKLTTSSELTIVVDDDLTGYRVFNDLSLSDFIKKFFSIKSAINPIYYTTFIILTVPIIYIPWHITKVWFGAMKFTLQHFTYRNRSKL